ncbi:hypothetical protein JCM21531_2771 [Acetivibrio straminisolvens JCM 21531]|uniref:Uncharacterized protein n=1 Tax=Acetivibrio straminisolvens JCM 21531 TaxID=1294263 RepID=W4V931_9FIRM|nr:hypothetical protein JCM21531_2771 [Acetivibrio straminisolvens JCM 21531]
MKLDILKLVALCSGRLTSVIRASQLGMFADWAADANTEKRNTHNTQGLKTIGQTKRLKWKMRCLRPVD